MHTICNFRAPIAPMAVQDISSIRIGIYSERVLFTGEHKIMRFRTVIFRVVNRSCHSASTSSSTPSSPKITSNNSITSLIMNNARFSMPQERPSPHHQSSAPQLGGHTQSLTRGSNFTVKNRTTRKYRVCGLRSRIFLESGCYFSAGETFDREGETA